MKYKTGDFDKTYTLDGEPYWYSEEMLEAVQEQKPLTNADRIRNMTDEELANVLVCQPDQSPPHGKHCSTYDCNLCLISWLKQEVRNNA